MELCVTRGISNLLLRKPPALIAPNRVRTVLHCRSRFQVTVKQGGVKNGSPYHTFTCFSSTIESTTYDAATTEKTAPKSIPTEEFVPEAAGSEEISSDENSETESTTIEATSYTKEEPEPEPEGVITVTVEEPDPVLSEKKEELISQPDEVPHDSSSGDDQLQLSKLLEDLNIKFDYEDKYSYLALGGGAFLTLWISAAVVRAIDSIPLLPIVLELVGLGFTLWFSTRYLIFTESRQELVARVNEFKEEVFGSEED